MSQDYQIRWSYTKEDNLSGPVVHATTCTLTPTTLANPSHNSRVSRVHPPSRATTQGIRSEPQLKEHQQCRPSRYHQSFVDHASQKHCKTHLPHQKLFSDTHEVLGQMRIQIAWWGTRTVRHQTPLQMLTLHLSPGRTNSAARRHVFVFSDLLVVAWWFP